MTSRETSESSSHVSHAAYVHAVVAALDKLGIEATDLQIQYRDTRRAAMTVAEQEPSGTQWDDAEWIRLRWDERTGWAWQVRYTADEQPRGPIYFGFSAVPPPQEVANWMLISLNHPEVQLSQEIDGEFTTPDLDAVLRTYAATAG